MTAIPLGAPGIDGAAVELFETRRGRFERILVRRDGAAKHSTVGVVSDCNDAAREDRADQAWLRASTRPASAPDDLAIRSVDLFSGCGGLSLGIFEAARALGHSWQPVLALDANAAALATYTRNFRPEHVLGDDIRSVFDGDAGERTTLSERRLAHRLGTIDVLVGGPPCQGHSDLNNRTRRSDGKNALYTSMVRAAEVLTPKHILIENVPGALHDRTRVVQRSADRLRMIGYEVSLGIVDLTELGVPQRRRRLALLASMGPRIEVASLARVHGRGLRGLGWAIGDLVNRASHDSPLLDQPANSAAATRTRIDHLFDHDLYDLPDSERPPCHSGGDHTYKSIYGRLRWDSPAQTVTTGFYSMCMGRYVHPSERRTLTAHEAARLQYFPDWFDFSPAVSRSELATMIGNAAPMRLSYAAAVEWFR